MKEANNVNITVAEGITPEQLAEHIRKALSEYHPHAVKAAVAAIESARMRMPN